MFGSGGHQVGPRASLPNQLRSQPTEACDCRRCCVVHGAESSGRSRESLHAAGRSDGFESDNEATADEGFDLEAAQPLTSARPAASALALHAVGSQGIQHSIRSARSKGNPAMLVSDRAQQALSEATRSGVKALPLWDSRTSSSKPGGSVMKEHLKSWLDSDSGRAWQAIRNERVAESAA